MNLVEIGSWTLSTLSHFKVLWVELAPFVGRCWCWTTAAVVDVVDFAHGGLIAFLLGMKEWVLPLCVRLGLGVVLDWKDRLVDLLEVALRDVCWTVMLWVC